MTPATVTGERVTTRSRGFNPTWQRHVAAYRAAAPLFGPGRVLDLGCGIGHSYELLAPRETVGLDRDASALAGQDRVTVLADMRRLPFPPHSFASVLSVHSIEHVPDAGVVLAEVVRVLEPGGTAVFVTPNRFTFARPDEIIDPYHYVEYGPAELARAARRAVLAASRSTASSGRRATSSWSPSRRSSSTGCSRSIRSASGGSCPADCFSASTTTA